MASSILTAGPMNPAVLIVVAVLSVSFIQSSKLAKSINPLTHHRL
jgi:hypothetical protein